MSGSFDSAVRAVSAGLRRSNQRLSNGVGTEGKGSHSNSIGVLGARDRTTESLRTAVLNGAVARRTALYDQCGAAAYSLCLTIVEDEVLAADIVRSCFSAAPDDEAGDACRWLLGEAHRRAVLAVRGHVIRRETNRKTHDRLRAFEMLDDEQQTMLCLVYFQGLTVSDVADRLGASQQHVLHVLTVALETFKSVAGTQTRAPSAS